MTEPAISVENQNLVTQLRDHLKDISAQITSAELEDAKYTVGLVKSLIAVRLQILQITKALMEQRVHAAESGAPITVVVTISSPDEVQANQLYQELAKQAALVEHARAEAARYTGGLVAAMKASTIATQENSLAMLRQQYLIAKYGLAFPRVSADIEPDRAKSPDKTAASNEHEAGAVEAPAKTFEIVAVDTRVTESNSSWLRYAWRLTLRSLATTRLQLDARLEFQDREGFVIADHTEYGLNLHAGEEQTFTGYELITASVARNVARVVAKVKIK